MTKLLVLAAVAFCAPIAGAKVWTVVYRCDGVTPLSAIDPNFPYIYPDIMVGTKLVLVVRSDAPVIDPNAPAVDVPFPSSNPASFSQKWAGSLSISWDDRLHGTLSGRGYNAQWRNYEGSCLPAAGTILPVGAARAGYRENAGGAWFDLAVDMTNVAGDWFVLDYRARQTGICHVMQYDQVGNPRVLTLTEVLSFNHVSSRDFNGDTVVDSRDFSLLAAHWGSTASPDPNDPAAAFDLDGDGRVAIGDIASFSEYWLQRTDCLPPAEDGNDPAPGL